MLFMVQCTLHGKKWCSAVWLNAMHSGKKWRIRNPFYITFLYPDYVATRSVAIRNKERGRNVLKIEVKFLFKVLTCCLSGSIKGAQDSVSAVMRLLLGTQDAVKSTSANTCKVVWSSMTFLSGSWN